MAINTGVNTSKLVGFAVLTLNVGVDASKLGGFSVLALNAGVNASKLGGLAVLGSIDTSPPNWVGTFPNGYKFVPYSATVNVTGALPLTLSLLSGSVPTGLSLSYGASSATLSGTPTATGTFNFTLRAVNSNGTKDQAFTVIISVTVTVTNTGF